MFLEPRAIYDIAFIGWGRRPGDAEIVAVYDWQRLCDAVMDAYDFDALDACDHVASNIEDAWAGPSTPLIIHRGTPYDLEQLL